MTFAFTLLETHEWRRDKPYSPLRRLRANKTFAPDWARPYDLVTWWKAYPKEVPTLEAFAAALEWLADQPHMMIIRGELLLPVPADGRVRRCWNDPKRNYFEQVVRSWMVFDFDDTPVPAGLADGSQVQACGLYLRSLLPPEFRGVRAVASVTGSTGRNPNGGARLRLFFLLEDRISDTDLTLWMKGLDWTWKLKLDSSILGTVQPVYTARPTFVGGMVDPVPRDRRVCVLPGGSDYVDLDLDMYANLAEKQQKKETRARKKSDGDWRGILDRELGSIDTHHEVIWRALGAGIAVGEDDETLVDYVVAAVAALGDPERARRYDAHYIRDRIRHFNRLEVVKAEQDRQVWNPTNEEIEAGIRSVNQTDTD